MQYEIWLLDVANALDRPTRIVEIDEQTYSNWMSFYYEHTRNKEYNARSAAALLPRWFDYMDKQRGRAGREYEGLGDTLMNEVGEIVSGVGNKLKNAWGAIAS